MERDRAEGVARAVGKELGEQVAVQRDRDAGSQGIRSEMALMCSELDGLMRYDQVRPETAHGVRPAGSGPHPFPGHRMPPTTGGTSSAARRLPLSVSRRRWPRAGAWPVTGGVSASRYPSYIARSQFLHNLHNRRRVCEAPADDCAQGLVWPVRECHHHFP